MGDFESDVRDACWLSLSSQKFIEHRLVSKNYLDAHAEMTNLVLAQWPGRTILVCPIGGPPITQHHFIYYSRSRNAGRCQISDF
jgi:hypothetical protein